jgi:hypothetical protein
VARFKQQPALGRCNRVHLIDEQGQVLETVILPTTNAELQKRLESGNLFVHSTIMVRRAALEAVGGYRGMFFVSQDYDMYLRVADKKRQPRRNGPTFSKSISCNKKELQPPAGGWPGAGGQRRRIGGGPIPKM